jgi:hypothetical protein
VFALTEFGTMHTKLTKKIHSRFFVFLVVFVNIVLTVLVILVMAPAGRTRDAILDHPQYPVQGGGSGV